MAEGENKEAPPENIGAVVFSEALIGQVRKDDVTSMVQHQREMLSRFEKTNEMLINFNMLSSSRFETTSQEFRGHTQLLYDMKRDLDIVFRRIRKLKERLSKMHPEAFAACSNVYSYIEEEEQPDDERKSETTGADLPPQAEANVVAKVTPKTQVKDTPKTQVKVTPKKQVKVKPKVVIKVVPTVDVNKPSIQS